MEYLLLLAGVFMGWSLGTNDAANAFGTAVATGVVKYKQAIIIIAVFCILGAVLAGAGNLTSVSELATSNEVMASEEDLVDLDETDEGKVRTIVLKSALKAAIIFLCSGVTVFLCRI